MTCLRRCVAWTTTAAVVLLVGCGTPPGRPRTGSETLAPNDVLDFDALYASNCAGCHGPEGRGGAARALADPVYLSIVDKSTMRAVIGNGTKGTSMTAFAQRAGGMLTEKQIDVIASGILARWSRPGVLDDANPPPYAVAAVGEPTRGETVYTTYCESCHGRRGRGGPKGSAITNDAVLALISDQGLRTAVIAGRPELGAPDWRGNLPGRPMSNQEITDVVAWLASQRVPAPGQPYVASHVERR